MMRFGVLSESYLSLYITYEWFLKEAIRLGRIARGELKEGEGYRIDGDSEDHLRNLFGGNIKGHCWNGPVKVAREARHVLAHNAGKMTPKLANMDHPFLVCNDEIQVAAVVTTELSVMLRDRIQAVAKQASTMAEFAR